MKKKISNLLKKIQGGKYGTEYLKDLDSLPRKIASDISVNISEAKAIMGYLISRNYVKIDPSRGVVILL